MNQPLSDEELARQLQEQEQQEIDNTGEIPVHHINQPPQLPFYPLSPHAGPIVYQDDDESEGVVASGATGDSDRDFQIALERSKVETKMTPQPLPPSQPSSSPPQRQQQQPQPRRSTSPRQKDLDAQLARQLQEEEEMKRAREARERIEFPIRRVPVQPMPVPPMLPGRDADEIFLQLFQGMQLRQRSVRNIPLL